MITADMMTYVFTVRSSYMESLHLMVLRSTIFPQKI